MSLDRLFKTAKKFEKKYGQVQITQSGSLAQDNAFSKIANAVGISRYIKNIKSSLNTSNPSDNKVNVKATLNVIVNNAGIATSATTTSFDVYHIVDEMGGDTINKINMNLLKQFGDTVAKNMVNAYQTNPACKKELLTQYAENKVPEQTVVVKTDIML